MYIYAERSSSVLLPKPSKRPKESCDPVLAVLA